MARHKRPANVLDMTWCSCSPKCRRHLFVGVTEDGRYLWFKVEVPHRRYILLFDKRSLRRLFKSLLKSVDYLDPENQQVVRGLISQMVAQEQRAA
jgi:hypothetical protein